MSDTLRRSHNLITYDDLTALRRQLTLNVLELVNAHDSLAQRVTNLETRLSKLLQGPSNGLDTLIGRTPSVLATEP